MGSDADAAIVYGFAFEGEDFDFDAAYYQNDPEKWLAKFQGCPEPEGSYDTNPTEWSEYWRAQKELPIVTKYDGDSSRGSTTTYLCIKESSLDGDWCCGGTKIPVGHVKPPPPEWDALLKAFCEKAGLPFTQPDWYLLVNYG